MIIVSTFRDAKASGTNIKLKRIMVCAKLALKKNQKNKKELRKILTLNMCLIAKELVNKKI